MTTLDKQIIKQNLRRRPYKQAQPDPIADAVVISRKVQGNGCFRAVVSAALLLAGVAMAVLG